MLQETVLQTQKEYSHFPYIGKEGLKGNEGSEEGGVRREGRLGGKRKSNKRKEEGRKKINDKCKKKKEGREGRREILRGDAG